MAKVIGADFLLSFEEEDIAAAQVFHLAEGICPVISWGDLPEHSHFRVMIFLLIRFLNIIIKQN